MKVSGARIARMGLTALLGMGLGVSVALSVFADAAWDELERCTRTGLTLEEQILLRRLLLQVRQNLT